MYLSKNKGAKQWKLQRLVSKNDLHMVEGTLAVILSIRQCPHFFCSTTQTM